MPFKISLQLKQRTEDCITDAVASLWHSFLVVNSQKVYQLGSTCTSSCFVPDFKPLEQHKKKQIGTWEILQPSCIEISDEDSYGSTVTGINPLLVQVPMFPLVEQEKIVTITSNALLHCVITENHAKDGLSIVYWCEYSEVCYILRISTKHYTTLQPRHLQGQSPSDVPNHEHLLQTPETYILPSQKKGKTSCCITNEALYIFLFTI